MIGKLQETRHSKEVHAGCSKGPLKEGTVRDALIGSKGTKEEQASYWGQVGVSQIRVPCWGSHTKD